MRPAQVGTDAGTRRVVPEAKGLNIFRVPPLMIKIQGHAVFGADGLVDHHLYIAVVGGVRGDQLVVIADTQRVGQRDKTQQAQSRSVDAAGRNRVAGKGKIGSGVVNDHRLSGRIREAGKIAGSYERARHGGDSVDTIPGALPCVVDEPESLVTAE